MPGSKATTAVQGGVPNGTKHLKSIAEDGRLEGILSRAEESDSNEVRRLAGSRKCNLEHLREKAHRHAKKVTAANSKAQFFERILIRDPLDPAHELNPVLLCTIVRLEGLEEQFNELFDEACRNFSGGSETYCDALGRLLPAEFAKIADRIDYKNCTNDTAAEDLDAFEERLESLRDEVAAGGLLGVPTGVKSLDDALSGIHGVTFLAATKGVGKTTLMLSTTLATLRNRDDFGVLILSFDEPKDRIYQRLFCMEAGITHRQLLAPDADVRNSPCYGQAKADAKPITA